MQIQNSAYGSFAGKYGVEGLLFLEQIIMEQFDSRIEESIVLFTVANGNFGAESLKGTIPSIYYLFTN